MWEFARSQNICCENQRNILKDAKLIAANNRDAAYTGYLDGEKSV